MITRYQDGPYTATESDGVVTVRALETIFCLYSDTKPTENIANGSIAVEIDTGKVFFFNEEGGAWVEQFSFQ